MEYKVDDYHVYLSREPIAVSADLPEPVNFTTQESSGGTSDVSTSDAATTSGKGKKVSALFTCYGPESNGRWKKPNGTGVFADGGNADAALARGDLCCAGPSVFGRGKIAKYPFGTRIQILGTGTDQDGKIYTVRDHGGAIKISGDVWHFDLLMTASQRKKFGKRNGQAIILED